MSKALGLLDSNVIIAAAAADHEHHGASARLLNDFAPQTFAVASHSYAEAYSQLTRRSPRSLFGFPPADVIAVLESIAASSLLVGLTHGKTFDAIREFAAAGHVGPRLYDKLIGEAAVANGIERIITWNVGHFSSLFPQITVQEPTEISAANELKRSR